MLGFEAENNLGMLQVLTIMPSHISSCLTFIV